MSALTRRHLIQTASLALPALALPPEKRPNLLFLLADDLGYGDLASYGAPDVRTPNIDGIGARGMRFTHAYANAPECSPTRCAFMTGRYQQRVGGLECAIGVGNVGRYDEAEWLAGRGELGLPVSETSIARMLKDAGYDTCLSGKWHLGYLDKFSPNRHGFDEYFGIIGGNADYFTHREEGGAPVLYHNSEKIERKGYTTDLIGEHAVGWLKQRGRRPFFHYVAFTAPHMPIQAPDERGKINNKDRGTYVKMINRMDDMVGAILAQIDKMGAAENTFVVFMSDNGGTGPARNAPLRGHKGLTFEGGIRVPCMTRWPGVIPAGRTTRQVAITMDWTATFLHAAGVAPRRKLDGIDLMPVLSGKQQPSPRTLFFRYKRMQNRRWAVIDGDLKYVRDNGEEMVFDLAADESEEHDLIAQRRDDARRLSGKLAAWEKEVAPPRLSDFRPEK